MRDADFDEFVTAESPALKRIAFVLTDDRQRAEDLVQDTLVTLWTRRHRLDRLGAPAYARTVMTRMQIARRRRFWNRERPSAEPPDSTHNDPDTTARLMLQRALQQLSLADRQVIVLRYVDDLSVRDVARIVGVSEAATQSRCRRALAQLATLTTQSPDSE